ncbi:TetR family transcriptional regulator [Phyllobacterium phragmitis]|uniref:TetR family transcriptional regulator n=1 Tax=Phyllobacterium phragmitis TaxID=2670329 RepID=A0A2S9IM89_9HYPH|nr:TetR family transcriptional regulator [Phyllobacterium phragmitis]PRD41635.1 TetR family transcriptional regulator [Phyllobacterium phragmitis]
MRRTKAEAEETREAILEAAEHAFLENGVNQSTLMQIAQCAGVTRGAIYFHFKDKADIYKAIVDRIRFPQEDLVEQVQTGDQVNPLDILLEAAISCLKMFDEDERQQRVFTIINQRCEYVGELSQVLDRLRQANTRVHQLFVRLLQLCKRRKMLSSDWTPEDAARALIAAMSGLLNEWVRTQKAFDLVDVGTKSTRALIASFRRNADIGGVAYAVGISTDAISSAGTPTKLKEVREHGHKARAKLES